MYYDIESLRSACGEGQKFKYLFFWGHTPLPDGTIGAPCLSQWWPCRFTADGVDYCCAEQFMMAEKARMFGDPDMLAQIMNTTRPKEMKAYGRAVRNFDQQRWENACSDIVYRASIEKFSQNHELWEYLKNTGKRILVEASPRDRIWGIGMGKANPDAENPAKWRGKNRLGFALTKARDTLIERKSSNG